MNRAERRNQWRVRVKLAKIWGTPRADWHSMCLPSKPMSKDKADKLAKAKAERQAQLETTEELLRRAKWDREHRS